MYKPPGQFLFHTGVTFGMPLPSAPSGSSTVGEVFATGRPAISGLVTGSALGRRIFGTFIPIVREDQVAFVMAFASVPLAIYHILEDQHSPNDWVSIVFDRNGTVVARDTLFQETLGKPAPADLVAASRGSNEGTVDYRDLAGVKTHAAFVKLPGSGWTVATGIPLADLNAPWVNALWTGGSSLAVAAFLAIVFAMLYGRLISRPVLELSALAAALGRGERIPAQRLNLKEAQVAADQMHIAGAELDQRARDIGHLNVALSQRANALEVANQELEGLSYSTSHVFRAPLRAIDGFSQILLDEHSATLDIEGKRLIGVLRSSARTERADRRHAGIPPAQSR
jgi:signal transduction histidine kinase